MMYTLLLVGKCQFLLRFVLVPDDLSIAMYHIPGVWESKLKDLYTFTVFMKLDMYTCTKYDNIIGSGVHVSGH